MTFLYKQFYFYIKQMSILQLILKFEPNEMKHVRDETRFKNDSTYK